MIAMVFVHVHGRLNELKNKTEPRYDSYGICTWTTSLCVGFV